MTEGDDKENEGYSLGDCTNNNSGSCKWNVNVKLLIFNTDIKFKVDTGADVSILNYDSYRNIYPRPNILPCAKKLVTSSGELKCLGIVRTDMGYKRVSIRDGVIYSA